MATSNIRFNGASPLALSAPEDQQTNHPAGAMFTGCCCLPVLPVGDAEIITDFGADAGLAAACLRMFGPEVEINCFDPADVLS